jgi:hypothetical protein
VSFGVLRNRLPDTPRPYRTPAGPVMGPLAFIVANLIILWSGWETAWKLGIAILIGYVILIANRVFRLNPITPVLDWKAAQWLPVYLIGMGLIVYLSDFGPLKDPVFPLWWDMVVVAVFSIVIYLWAMAVALSREQIEEMISEVVVPEEDNLQEVPLG